MRATIKIAPDGSLEFYSPYDPHLVADLKMQIPYSDRRWDAARKCWLIAARNQDKLEGLCFDYLGEAPTVQASLIKQAQVHQTQLYKVEYIGAPKEREDGSITATGYVNGDWSVVFPQDVLQRWFELGGMENSRPENTSTLYGLLGVKRDSNGSDIKSGYRKMARRWHPDINKDSDAPDMMKRINDAYQVLSNPQTRRKYNAGLALEASLKNNGRQQLDHALSTNSWRPPVRCGWLLVEGRSVLGRFVVSRISQWEDITNAAGQIMVASWPAGNEHFEVNWV